MPRDVFHHCAYEVYADLLLGLRELLPLVIAQDTATLAPRSVELAREAHARYSRPYPLDRDEAGRAFARLAAFGVVDVVVPEVIASGKWRFLLRSIARLERIRELHGPVDLLRDDFLRGAHALAPDPYVPPRELRWERASDFVRDAVGLAETTGDEVGIGGAINETPEAHAFFAQYPDAYGFWDLHRQLGPDEDPDRPAPLEYPAAIWSASAIALAEPFADLPCGSEGPVTFQPAGVAPAAHLHPALVAACEAAAGRGHLVAGYVVVHP